MSTDGGTNWQRIDSGASTDYFGVSAVNGHTGWAVGKNGIIAKTVDAWANLDYQRTRTISSDILDASFISADRGWIITSTTVYRTSDGGNVWEFLGSDNTGLKSVMFVDIAHGWIVGSSGNIQYTSSGGAVWVPQTSNTTVQLYDIHFIDLQNGWAVGSSGVILKTIDGGSNWTAGTSGTTEYLYSVYFVDANTGWVTGEWGWAAKSVDGGNTWTRLTSLYSGNRALRSVYFHDSQTGWAVGGGTYAAGLTYRTIDGGTTWGSGSQAPTYLTSVHFADSKNGLAVGNDGVLLKTGNGGITWSINQANITDLIYNAVQFVDAQTAILVGGEGIILSGSIKLSPSVSNAIPDPGLDEDFTLTVLANLDSVFADADSPNLAYSAVTDGYTTAEIAGSLLSLSAIQDYYGTSTVTVTATDEQPVSVDHIVTVTVNSINDDPVLAGLPDLAFTEDDSTQLDLDSYVSDADHDTTEITFMADVIGAAAQAPIQVKAGLGGDFRIDVDSGDLVITIDGTSHVASLVSSADSSGTFTVVFTATDDSAATDTDTLDVTVSPVNDLPIAVNDNATTAEDTAAYILVLANDFDVENGLSLLVTDAWTPIHGTTAISNDTVIYTPELNYFGPDTFSYVMSDGTAGLDTAKVFITVTSVNDPPVLAGLPDISFPEDSNTTLPLNQYVSDVDHDTTQINFSGPSPGTTEINVEVRAGQGAYFWSNYTNLNGEFEVVISASDGFDTDTDTMLVTITPVNDPPGMFTAYAPENNTAISIEAANLDIYLSFAWSPTTDPEGDVVRYRFDLTGTLGNALPDSLFSQNSLNLQYREIAEAMLAAGSSTSASGTWTIFATDGQDSTLSSNEPFLLFINLGNLAITDILGIPTEYALHPNYPNPFNPSTTVRFDLPEAAEVQLVVYDIRGREVVRLVNGRLEPAYHQITWNGRTAHGIDVPTGIYIARLHTTPTAGVTPQYSKSIKMVMLK